jgi:hypothetical protein
LWLLPSLSLVSLSVCTSVPCHGLPPAYLQVKLYTTDQVDAGFDGEVHLTLRGNNGNAEEVQVRVGPLKCSSVSGPGGVCT